MWKVMKQPAGKWFEIGPHAPAKVVATGLPFAAAIKLAKAIGGFATNEALDK